MKPLSTKKLLSNKLLSNKPIISKLLSNKLPRDELLSHKLIINEMRSNKQPSHRLLSDKLPNDKWLFSKLFLLATGGRNIAAFLCLTILSVSFSAFGNPFEAFAKKTEELQEWLTTIGTAGLGVCVVVAVALLMFKRIDYKWLFCIVAAGLGIKFATFLIGWISN